MPGATITNNYVRINIKLPKTDNKIKIRNFPRESWYINKRQGTKNMILLQFR